LSNFANKTRILWYDPNYPKASTRPDLPVRFALGDFISLDTTDSSDTYYKFNHTPFTGYKIDIRGQITEAN